MKRQKGEKVRDKLTFYMQPCITCGCVCLRACFVVVVVCVGVCVRVPVHACAYVRGCACGCARMLRDRVYIIPIYVNQLRLLSMSRRKEGYVPIA